MKRSRAVAPLLIVAAGCGSPSPVEIVHVSVALEDVAVALVQTGDPGSFLVVASASAADRTLAGNERVQMVIESGLGDREIVRLGPLDCAEGGVTYDCRRFTISLEEGADEDLVRTELGKVGAHLIVIRVCSTGDGCAAFGLAAGVVTEAGDLARAMAIASGLPGVSAVEHVVNGGPAMLSPLRQQLVAFLPASTVTGGDAGDQVLSILGEGPTPVSMESGDTKVLASLQAPGG